MASRIESSACFSFATAPVYEVPVFVHDDRDLDVPARPAEQFVGGVVADAGDDADDAPGAVLQLLRVGLDVDHQVAVGLADAHHRDGGQHVQHHLGRGAGLQPGRPGEHFGADAGRDDQVDEVLQLGAPDRR